MRRSLSFNIIATRDDRAGTALSQFEAKLLLRAEVRQEFSDEHCRIMREKLVGLPAAAYRLSTIDGWAMRLVTLFPARSGADPAILALANPRTDYPAIRRGAWEMIKAGHINELLAASYSRLIVDEHQDCSVPQHAIIYFASRVLPTCVLGDPMQAIFGFGDPLADWDQHVCVHFPLAGELTIPWRWKNAGTEDLGHWLLEVRKNLTAGLPVDLRGAPPQVTWVHLNGADDHARRLKAGLIKAPNENGYVLIIGDSVNPPGQRQFASQTPGAVTVESVDMRDFVSFAKSFNLEAENALEQLVAFAQDVMTNVGGADLLNRVGVLKRGTARKDPTDTEAAALRFVQAPTYGNAIEVLVELGKQAGVRTHRPSVLQACIKTLGQCGGENAPPLYDAALAVREHAGRQRPRKSAPKSSGRFLRFSR